VASALCFFASEFYIFMPQNLNDMKKLFPVAAVAVLAMMFTSCKKDYTCTCKITSGGTALPDVVLPFTKTTKSKATDACKTAETTYTSAASTAKCSL